MDEEAEEKLKFPMKLENFILNRAIENVKGLKQTLKFNISSKNICQKDIREHTGCINAVQFSKDEQLLATGGDDLNVRIWKVGKLISDKKPKPENVSEKAHDSNIFSLEFDGNGTSIYSGERWGTVMKHDVTTGQTVYVSKKFKNRGDVYHISQNPVDNNIIAVTRQSLITFLDDRDRQNPIAFKPRYGKGLDYYTADFHPVCPRIFLTNSETGGPEIYDMRMQIRPIFIRSDHYTGFPERSMEWMGSMWSPSGDQFLSLRRSNPPLFTDLVSTRCFSLKSAGGYYNRHTIKSMTFFDDFQLATGSDKWGIHIWDIPKTEEDFGFTERRDKDNVVTSFIVEKETQVLKGHRSIPNQVRFSPRNQILVSSGVENSFKLWSEHQLPWSYDIPFPRRRRFHYENQQEEISKERENRRILEDALDRDGLMEGRACWDDVFGGDILTAEDRSTLEQFDDRAPTESSSSSESVDSEFDDEFIRQWRVIDGGDDNPNDSDDDSDDDSENDDQQRIVLRRRNLRQLRNMLPHRPFALLSSSSSESDDDDDDDDGESDDGDASENDEDADNSDNDLEEMND